MKMKAKSPAPATTAKEAHNYAKPVAGQMKFTAHPIESSKNSGARKGGSLKV